MVHALSEIQRVMILDGTLIDLRPITSAYPVEVASSREAVETGHLTGLPEGTADDQAATQAIQEAGVRGWFSLEREEEFNLYYYWDRPSEMKEFIESEWEDFEKIDEDVMKATQSAWAVADADARVRVRVRMMIALWKKP
jgi:hypothetical protein